MFDYTVGANDQTSDLAVNAVNLNGATIVDADGNPADLSGAVNGPANGEIGTNLQVGPAYVMEVTASQAGEVSTGAAVAITLTLSEAVTVNTSAGSPILSLNDNATATYDANASDPSAGTLAFDYTVGATDYTTDLAATGINLNGATIQDANGVNADLAGAVQDLGLDVNAAVVTAVTTSQTGEVAAGPLVKLTLTMSEGVTVNTSLGAPTLTLNDGAEATYDAAASDPSVGTLVFDHMVGAADQTPELAVTQVNLNGATIEDANGNAADLSGAVSGFASGQFALNLQVGPAVVTALAPSQTGELNAGQTITMALAVSDAVTVNTSGGLPSFTAE